jgi:hypothetical protein
MKPTSKNVSLGDQNLDLWKSKNVEKTAGVVWGYNYLWWRMKRNMLIVAKQITGPSSLV